MKKLNRFKASFLAVALMAISNASFANFLSWDEIETLVAKEGINTKALSHVKCFFDQHENSVFQKKNGNQYSSNRCYNRAQITLDQKRVFALIDYTKNSNEERMFLIDRKTGGISKMAVAHGRFNGSIFNMKLKENENSVMRARYYSNKHGSNAPSSGFFVAGDEYEGKFGRSLVVHGLEEGINDNACERAVVIHKHAMVTKKNVYAQSKGCPMISSSYIDHVIDILKSPSQSIDDNKHGSVVFIYGEREKQWDHGTCEGNFRL